MLGLLGCIFYLVDNAGVMEPNARLVFAAVITGMSIVAGLVLMPPMAYTFWAFPVDLFFFAAWLTVFCLLETVSLLQSDGPGGWLLTRVVVDGD